MGKPDTVWKKESTNNMCTCKWCKCKEQLKRNERAIRHRLKVLFNKKRIE